MCEGIDKIELSTSILQTAYGKVVTVDYTALPGFSGNYLKKGLEILVIIVKGTDSFQR